MRLRAVPIKAADQARPPEIVRDAQQDETDDQPRVDIEPAGQGQACLQHGHDPPEEPRRSRGQQIVAPLTNQTASDSFGLDMVPQSAGPLLAPCGFACQSRPLACETALSAP